VYRLDQGQSLRFKAHMEQAEARIRLVDELLSILQRREAA
jgi:hypothetical protein